jgi:AraC-like DNA-binding protein
VEELSRVLFVDPSTLYRKLKPLIGLSPSQYLRALRLARAKRLLSTTDRTIYDIALDCGFNELSYFSRVFKKEAGQSPTAYRRSAAGAPRSQYGRLNH